MAKQIPYKVRLHIISPVHIGCDDVYEPTGFVVDKTAKKLIAFDQLDFVRSLTPTDRSKFMALCEKGTLESILDIYKFMWNLPTAPPGHAVDVSKGFLETYERVATKLNPRDAKQELNKFQIGRTSYLPSDQAPYIPGSALKGALRTGWLNHLNCGKNNHPRGLEELLLGGTFANDPFRLVKISDLLPVGNLETRICFAVNKKKKTSKYEPRGPQQILEVIRHDCETVFEGMITLHTQEQGGGITKPVPVGAEFFAKATGFFGSEMDAEEIGLKGISLPATIRLKMVNTFGDRYMKSVFPVRIGRHSGAECLTVDGVRTIKIMGKKGDHPTYSPHSTTVWLAGDSNKATTGLLPFGWVALEVLDVDPAAPLWPERTVSVQIKNAPAAPPVKAPPPPPAQIVWCKATITWNPGSQTLTAQNDGKKAETKLSTDRSLVPEALHKKLFVKKDAIKADVTVEQQGNAWRIVGMSI
ncbi:MAG TPA: type III-A CRISPR-associated RAMP protein Csm5 [Desulfuromonadales bacterium]|nr:type III-A CRISPR-associated RAMP protein Csm5 [Desulfuromonadales bacterium]